jgi:cyclase
MRKRLIPVLLIDRNKRLVKTEQFGTRTYVGDPFNVVRLFNEKEVDELCVLDIDATRDQRPPDFGFLRELASECFMPLAYGGGITHLEHCERLNRDGVEKFVLGHGTMRAELVHALCNAFGSQAVVGCVDVLGLGKDARCITTRGHTTLKPDQLCANLQAAGVGEILLQSVDRDGMRSGYDLELVQQIAHQLSVPLIALGGAGTIHHLAAALHAGASAVASGSAFTFIGRLRGVLITYPDVAEMDRIDQEAYA